MQASLKPAQIFTDTTAASHLRTRPPSGLPDDLYQLAYLHFTHGLLLIRKRGCLEELRLDFTGYSEVIFRHLSHVVFDERVSVECANSNCFTLGVRPQKWSEPLS
jgi:hypothetical protein